MSKWIHLGRMFQKRFWLSVITLNVHDRYRRPVNPIQPF